MLSNWCHSAVYDNPISAVADILAQYSVIDKTPECEF